MPRRQASLDLPPVEDEELEQIRQALEQAVARASLRSVARDLGMSPTGLRGVIDGSAPYVKTWDKLQVWFALYQKDASRDLPAGTIAHFLRRLLRDVPERSQPGAAARVLNGFDEAFRFAGVQAPGWIAEIRKGLAG
ncbi:MAG TPA: hypothetical protein VF746_06005 [Longimicrobium sp.]